jgi:hypothetical protein
MLNPSHRASDRLSGFEELVLEVIISTQLRNIFMPYEFWT